MRRWTALAAAAGLTATAVTGATLVEAAPGGAQSPAVEHCVVRVTGTKPSGELETTPPVCSPDRDRALRTAGVAAQDVPLGIHYDGQGLTGSSFTVVGTVCAGGWLNLSSLWINRVSSTENFCPDIRHFDGYNLTSSSEDTYFMGGNLFLLNNRTNSIQYLP
jgi:hypothetical protein